ncbi:Gfo/Idh/MocA family oxidoreductase, partial [Staphylococcus epidermidis]
MLKVAVVGLGDISHVHIHAIQNSTKAQLVAVCDENEKLSQQVPHVNYY